MPNEANLTSFLGKWSIENYQKDPSEKTIHKPQFHDLFYTVSSLWNKK